MSDHLLVETRDRVGLLRINRPSRMNALNDDLARDICAALFANDTDPAIGCNVIIGSDKAFAAGADIGAMAEWDYAKVYADDYITKDWEGIRRVRKPVIAAVAGYALGGGCELAMACDIVIAADTASFGLPEPRVGAMALGGGIHRLVRQIGLKPAMGMLLACQRIDAHEAHALGIVNEVVPLDQLHAATGRWVDEILKAAPTAVRATKEAALRGLEEPTLGAAIRAQSNYPQWIAHMSSPNAKEGRQAFVEKRPPRWTD